MSDDWGPLPNSSPLQGPSSDWTEGHNSAVMAMQEQIEDAVAVRQKEIEWLRTDNACLREALTTAMGWCRCGGSGEIYVDSQGGWMPCAGCRTAREVLKETS